MRPVIEKEVNNPAGTDIQIRTMEEQDLKAVYAIEAQCFTHVWTEAMFKASLEQWPLSQSWVVIRGQHIVGYLIASYIPRYAEQEGEVHISNIAVDPAYRRQHIGKMLLMQSLDYGDTHLCDTVSLEVRFSNRAARKFYRRYGFINVGFRPAYYGNEDALLMEASVPNALNLMQQGE